MVEKETFLGVIGGSGWYDLDDLENIKEDVVETPFGLPSDVIIRGKLSGRHIAFLSRHGKGHRFTPSEVNYRANIYAFKKIGVTHILSLSAVGSLQEELAPGTLVVPTQLLDRTKGDRSDTFFGNGVVGHVAFGDPYCPFLIDQINKAGNSSGIPIGDGGTLVVIEGPRFSSRAESNLYRSSGANIIGMTALPEASLAREAEIPYCTLAMITDYDCWKENEEDVDVPSVIAVLNSNVAKGKTVIRELLKNLPERTENPIFEASRNAIMTSPEAIPVEIRKKLEVLFGKYWEK